MVLCKAEVYMLWQVISPLFCNPKGQDISPAHTVCSVQLTRWSLLMSWIPICSAWCASPNSLGLLLPLPFDVETAVPCTLSHQFSLSFTLLPSLKHRAAHTVVPLLAWADKKYRVSQAAVLLLTRESSLLLGCRPKGPCIPCCPWTPCTLVTLVVFCKIGATKKKPSWTVLSSYWKTKFLAPATHPKWRSSQLGSIPVPQTAALQKVLCVCMCLSERHLHSFSVHPATEHKSTLTLLEKWKDGISQEPACAGGGRRGARTAGGKLTFLYTYRVFSMQSLNYAW